ncbi:iron-containing alcohol dehydrogenase [Nitratireductor sp.]|uniref:iron-containing alcohol dehydrogenase n=1 Tax=Nitratireductor sp. TaxID=1872084 RepID=UPI0025FEE97D|nr:iron-containing alcohol dehydrogenase [Nitratireductor sp.]
MFDAFGVMRPARTVLFGDGQRRAVGRVAAGFGKRALVCTDERFAATQEMAELKSLMEAQGIEVRIFDGTEPELPIAGVQECAEAYRDFAPTVIVGVGGGSCLDLAKLVSLLLAHGGSLPDYYGEMKVPGPIIPVVAIPTTAGTGSEVTPVAVLADSERELKVGVSSPFLVPEAAICDPELTITCPTSLTAIAGADALTHALEAYTAIRHSPSSEIAFERVFVGKNVMSDYHALEAIRAISQALPKAVANGSDLEARRMMMYGSVVAGLAFGVAGTAAAHAIQYPVGALTKTAHGLGVAALMPFVMRFNRPQCTNEFAQIARAMGAETQLDEDALADMAIENVCALFSSIGIPQTLGELGVPGDRLDWIAEKALLAGRLVNNNPRPLDLESVRQIVDDAHTGL